MSAHVGDIGTTIILTVQEDGVAVNISTATVKQIKLRKNPSGITKIFTAAFVTTGADGKIKYVTTAVSDLDEAGTWEAQAYIELPTGKWNSDPANFTVEANL